MGFRWDYQGAEWEQNDQMSEMSLTLPNPGAGNLPGAYRFARQEHVRNFVNNWHKGFSPRLGGAVQRDPHPGCSGQRGSSLGAARSGYYGRYPGHGRLRCVHSVNSPNGGVTPAMNWDVGWTNVPHPPIFDPAIYNGGNANTDAGNADRWPESYIWQLDVQKSFARDYIVNVGYVGQSSHHVPAGLNLPDQVDPKYLALGSLLTASISDPAVVAAGFKPPYPGFTGTLAQALKPYPQYYSINILADHPGNSSYNVLLMKVEKRFANGLQFLAAFTASKTITNAPMNAFGAPGPQDTFNRRVEKALAPYDIPRSLDVSATYMLPWGPGRPYLNHGYASHILGGWGRSWDPGIYLWNSHCGWCTEHLANRQRSPGQ